MRALIFLLLLSLCYYRGSGQFPLIIAPGAGAYSADQADIFSSFTNLAALNQLTGPAVALGGQRPLGLEELAVY